VHVPLTKPAVQISSAAAAHHCALLDDGSVQCWSWSSEPVAATGSKEAGAAELALVDLGTWTG
jgi:hypothetical protein